MATSDAGDAMTDDGSAWALLEPSAEDDDTVGDVIDESQAWFDESLEAFLENPANPEIHANFQEARHKFYREARKSLDKARVNRGFYPMGKGTGKSTGKTTGTGRGLPFRGKCMRCGKVGHKAADCRQAMKPSDSSSSGGGSGVGFVFANLGNENDSDKVSEDQFLVYDHAAIREFLVSLQDPSAMEGEDHQAIHELLSDQKDPAAMDGEDHQAIQAYLNDQKDSINKQDLAATAWVVSTAGIDGDLAQAFAVMRGNSDQKAIIDSGASESIVGVNTLQQIYDRMEKMGFDADKEVEVDRSLHKTFVFGNNQTSSALGLAKLGAGICGREQRLDVHVVEGSTPMLLSGKWLYDVGAVINFRTGRARFQELGDEEIQLERAPSYHLILPMNAYRGNDEVLRNLFTEGDPDPGIASVLNVSPCTKDIARDPAAAEQP